MQSVESDGKTSLEPIDLDVSPAETHSSRPLLLAEREQEQRVSYSATTPSAVRIHTNGNNRVSATTDKATMEPQPAAVGYQREKGGDDGSGCCGILLIIISYLLVIITFPLSLCFTVKVVQVRVLRIFFTIVPEI